MALEVQKTPSTSNCPVFFSTVLEKPKGTLWAFSTSIMLQNNLKIEGGHFGDIKNVSESLTVPKKLKIGNKNNFLM